MNRLAWITITLALTVFACADLRSELTARYKAWDEAYFRRDVKTLAGMLHPNMRLITGSGRVITRKAYVASLWKGDLPEVYQTTLLRGELKQGRADAWTREVSKMSGKDQQVHRYRDTWVKLKGRWMMLESKTLGED